MLWIHGLNNSLCKEIDNKKDRMQHIKLKKMSKFMLHFYPMRPKFFLVLCALVVFSSSCVHKVKVQPQPGAGEFPADVAVIMQTKCAITGCHNQASYGNADSLLLDNWTHLFQGGSDGAVAVPYSPEWSTLLYYVNTSDHGPIRQPLMPYSTNFKPLPPLTLQEYTALYNWIQNGAPDAKGNIAFATDATTRQKCYLVHGSCNRMIAVIDAATGLMMRAIPIGNDQGQTSQNGHGMRVSPDGMYAYVSVLGFNMLDKIDTRTDKVVDSLDLSAAESLYGQRGSNQWGDMRISPDGNSILLCDWTGFGCALLINTQSMTVTSGWGSLTWPHAVVANAKFDTFFVTANIGNTVYKLADRYIGSLNVIDTTPPSTQPTSIGLPQPNPHDIVMSPDYTKLFVSCQSRARIQVINAHTGQILDSIFVGTYPQDMAISSVYPYLFVCCMQDPAPGAGLGSVYVINYNTMQIVKKITNNFYAPHGITVDDKDGLVYIASTNQGGGACNVSSCSDPNGWYSAYNLSTLQPAFSNKRFIMFSDPFALDTRFK